MTSQDIQRFKTKVANWLVNEYGPSCDTSISNPSYAGILYSTYGDDDEHTVEVAININEKKFLYMVDGILVYTLPTKDIKKFGEWLDNLDWNEEYSIAVRKWSEKMEKGEIK